MTLLGTFDPSTETRPTTLASYIGSINLLANSSGELSLPTAGVGDFDVEWSTDFAHSGARSTKMTVDHGNAGTNAWVRFPYVHAGGGVRWSVWMYVPSGSPLIGEEINIGIGTASTGASSYAGPYTLVEGWRRLSFYTTATFNYLYLGVPFSSVLTNGGVMYVDDWQLEAGTVGAAWVPADDEPFYTAGQEWTCTGTDDFQGLAVTPSDILACVSSGYLIADDATWELTPQTGTVAEALTTKPLSISGVPIGLGDWRVAVEILLPTDAVARWGIAKWGESMWNGYAWADLTEWVRGADWSRGASQFAGRPEVGVCNLTLANGDRQFSPWNGVTAFRNATVLDDDGYVQPGYLGPGTVMRIVAHSPSGEIDPVSAPGGTVTIFDDFDSFDAAMWDVISGVPVWGGGNLSVASATVRSDAVYQPLVNTTATWRLASMPTGTVYRQFGWRAYRYIFEFVGGVWYCYDDDTGGSPIFTPEGDWFRIRGDGTTLFWETSADGVTWTTHHTRVPVPATAANRAIEIVAGADPIVFDSFQLDEVGIALEPTNANSWVPQITGIVESWTDDTVGVGADSSVNVTFIETLSSMAQVDDDALVGVVGLDDLPEERITRLLEAAGWKYGPLDDTYWHIAPGLSSGDYELQSTDMANNRISELYLTVDSVGGVIRSDRSGVPIFHKISEDGGIGYAIQRGPENGNIEGLGAVYADSIYGFTPPFVADSVRVANDDEVIVNDVRLTYVGGSQREDADTISEEQYGQVSYERSDLISKSDDLIDHLIESRLEGRARRPLRLASLQLHSAHEATLPAIIGLDIGADIDVHLAPLPTHTVTARNNNIDSLQHRLTALNGAEVIWTVDITFGIQQGIVNEEI